MPRECYTPGVWKFKHLGGHAWQIFSLIDDRPIAVVITTEHDARLIAEAPNLFQLVKQSLDLDKNEERQCSCALCEAGRTIVQRVLEG